MFYLTLPAKIKKIQKKNYINLNKLYFFLNKISLGFMLMVLYLNYFNYILFNGEMTKLF